jgi:hypothetical protein
MNPDHFEITSANRLTAWHFTAFRLLFGVYLAVHFAALVPWAGELFGTHGIMGNPALNPTAGVFPNPFNLAFSDTALRGIFLGLTGLSLMLATGLWRPVVSGLLWFFWTALFHRNNLIANPSIPYVGLLLALCVLIPTGEPWSLTFRRRGQRAVLSGQFEASLSVWAMPPWVMRTAWILLAAGYTFSGFTKLSSPSWLDGGAMRYLLDNPLARPGFVRDAMMRLPDFVLKLMTWGTLALELAWLPLACWRKSRPWAWLAMVGLHAGILLVLDFADLSFGMLMIHAFTFDPAWLRGCSRWWPKLRHAKAKSLAAMTGLLVMLVMLSGCSTATPHSGRFPVRLSERAPAHRPGSGMTPVLQHAADAGTPPADVLEAIRPGDVIAFHMSHCDAWSHLRHGTIQKLPYELFRYGHIALVVPEPGKSWHAGNFRLLQIAIKQAANASSGPEFLTGKSWVVYRPPAGSVDVTKLREFTAAVTVSAGNPKRAYDYLGTLGLKNAPWLADRPEDIGRKFTCATLVAAGLNYAGYPLHAVHRGGWLDIVTPRQVVDSGTRL